MDPTENLLGVIPSVMRDRITLGMTPGEVTNNLKKL